MTKRTQGRPKKPLRDRRSVTLRIRMTEAERAMFDAAAAKKHLDTSAWARTVLADEAKRLGVSGEQSKA